MEHRNYRNRKGQTGLQYSAPIKTVKPSDTSVRAEPAAVTGLTRYTLIQAIAAAIIIAVITVIRLFSGNLYQDIQAGIEGEGVAGLDVSDAASQVMSYMQENETFSQLFPASEGKENQGDGAVWTSVILSDNHLDCASKKDLACPVAYTKITSGYGYRTDPFSGQSVLHKGMDMAVPEGSTVLAAGNGVVAACAYDEVGGWYVVIDHGDQLQTYYGHLSKISVKQGDLVCVGQEIALSGNTGKTTGPHLHFEVVDNGQNVDPADYIHV